MIHDLDLILSVETSDVVSVDAKGGRYWVSTKISLKLASSLPVDVPPTFEHPVSVAR